MRVLTLVFSLLFVGAELGFAESRPVVVGVTLGLTGPADRWSRFQRMGIELAAEDLHHEGVAVRLAFEDSRSQAAQSVSNFNRLVPVAGANAVIGDVFSYLTEPLIPLAHAHKALLVSPSASEDLCEKSQGFFFTTASKVRLSGEAYGNFLDRHPTVRKVGLVYFQDPGWGHAYRDTWRKLLSERKLEVAGEFETAEFAPDFKTPLTKLLKSSPDALFVAHDPSTFLAAARHLNFKGPLVFANNILELPAARAPLHMAEGVYFVDTRPDSEFVGKFRRRFGELPYLEPYNGYEAVRSLARALSGEKMSTVRYTGVAGPIDFSSSCAGNEAKWYLKQFRNNEIVEPN